MSTEDPTPHGTVPPPPPAPDGEDRGDATLPPIPQAPSGTAWGTPYGGGAAAPYATTAPSAGADRDVPLPGADAAPYGTPPYGTPPDATLEPWAPAHGRSSSSTTGVPSPTPAPAGPSASGVPPYGTPGHVPSPYGPPPPPVSPGLDPAPQGATVALVLGILALLLAAVPLAGVVAMPLGVAAVTTAAVARNRARRSASHRPRGRATAGLVVGIVALVVAFVAQVGYAVVMTTAGEERAGEVAIEDYPPDADPGAAEDAEPGEDVVVEHDGSWQPLTAPEVAFGPDATEEGWWWYVVVVENPNPDHRFARTEFSVEALDADGTLIAASWEYVDVLPGRTAVTGRFRDLGDLTPDRLDVRLPVAQRVTSEPGVGSLTADDVTATATSWGGVTVEGTVRSTLDEDVASARVVVLATGPDGRVLGTARGYVDQLPAGGEAVFDATFFDELPAGSTFTAYASP